MNPYSVLGVSPNASKEEIKKAYHRLVKENHPDRFLDEEEKKKATERLAKINEAYNIIEKGQTGYSAKDAYRRGYNSYGYGGGESSEILGRVRRFIAANDILGAQSLLNAVQTRNAEWHYLQGVVYLRQGFYDAARRHLKTAVDMEPSNSEYVSAYNNLEANAGGFFGSNPYINIRGFNTSSCCLPSLCAAMCCSSCVCDAVSMFGRMCRC